MSSKPARRILIALDAHSTNERGINTLVDMAKRLNASLAGLYIEDSQLMSVAGLPFSTEINCLSAEEQFLNPEDLLRINKVACARARRLLEELTARDKLDWTFAVESGELAIRALSQPDCDIFFPARTRQHITIQRPALAIGQQLVLIYRGEETFDRMLEISQILSSNGAISDITIISETPLPPELSEKLPVQGVRLHFQLVRSTRPETLNRLKLPGGAVLMMTKQSLQDLTERQLIELVEQLPYPLMVVN